MCIYMAPSIKNLIYKEVDQLNKYDAHPLHANFLLLLLLLYQLLTILDIIIWMI